MLCPLKSNSNTIELLPLNLQLNLQCTLLVIGVLDLQCVNWTEYLVQNNTCGLTVLGFFGLMFFSFSFRSSGFLFSWSSGFGLLDQLDKLVNKALTIEPKSMVL